MSRRSSSPLRLSSPLPSLPTPPLFKCPRFSASKLKITYLSDKYQPFNMLGWLAGPRDTISGYVVTNKYHLPGIHLRSRHLLPSSTIGAAGGEEGSYSDDWMRYRVGQEYKHSDNPFTLSLSPLEALARESDIGLGCKHPVLLFKVTGKVEVDVSALLTHGCDVIKVGVIRIDAQVTGQEYMDLLSGTVYDERQQMTVRYLNGKIGYPVGLRAHTTLIEGEEDDEDDATDYKSNAVTTSPSSSSTTTSATTATVTLSSPAKEKESKSVATSSSSSSSAATASVSSLSTVAAASATSSSSSTTGAAATAAAILSYYNLPMPSVETRESKYWIQNGEYDSPYDLKGRQWPAIITKHSHEYYCRGKYHCDDMRQGHHSPSVIRWHDNGDVALRAWFVHGVAYRRGYTYEYPDPDTNELSIATPSLEIDGTTWYYYDPTIKEMVAVSLNDGMMIDSLI